MKLFLFLCVVSSLLINAMTSPLDDYLETMSHEERTGDSQQLLNEGQNNVESLPRDQLQSSEEDMFLQQDMDDAGNNNYTALFQQVHYYRDCVTWSVCV